MIISLEINFIMKTINSFDINLLYEEIKEMEDLRFINESKQRKISSQK